MRIGVFDSGVGGLLILRAITKKLPQYDYVYLGDTKRVPYGGRSQETIYDFTRETVEFLCQKGCKLIILACNTASSQALRRIQQEFLPQHYPDRRVLGVIIPTIEIVAENPEYKKVGVIATQATVQSGVFAIEMAKRRPDITVLHRATPLLVPLIEHDGKRWAKPILKEYLRPLLKEHIDALILGCTHYPVLKRMVRAAVKERVKIISQDELIPKKLADYLLRHPEIAKQLTRKRRRTLYLTDLTPRLQVLVGRWFGKEVSPKKIKQLTG